MELGSGTHPRPQMTRPRWFDLSGWWGFAYDDDDCGLDEHWEDDADVFTRRIRVPFPPESAASGIGDTGFHPVVWYRRTFADVRERAGESLLLHCGAIDYLAHVWVNGRLVAIHEGGQAGFACDITAACAGADCHSIVIRAEDSPHDLEQPRGKQDWLEEPHEIWYHRTTGIWRPVWLEPVPCVRIERLRWSPEAANGRVRLSVRLNRPPETGLSLTVTLDHRDAPLSTATSEVDGIETELELPLATTDDLLWSPESPTLLDATVALRSEEVELDNVQSYVGLRAVGVDGGRVTLNGEPIYLRMVLHQGYRPNTHLASAGDDELRREVELIRELGFNGVRVHQKVEDPRFLHWCDRLGLIAWGEMANALAFSATAAARLAREWADVVERDVNHPCIVAWVPLNESWGVPDVSTRAEQQSFVKALFFLTKTLDPTRLVVGNDGWEYVIGDVVTIHDYEQDPDVIRARYASLEETLRGAVSGGRRVMLTEPSGDVPVLLTEFGGMTLPPPADAPWFGYAVAETPDVLRAQLAGLFAAVHASTALAGFCYTQLADTLQETNGLVTAEGVPKLDAAVIREIVRG